MATMWMETEDDYPRVLVLEVTLDHCRNGWPGDSHRCPLALAFLDRFPERWIEVSTEEVTIYRVTGGSLVDAVYEVPDELTGILCKYDEDEIPFPQGLYTFDIG